MSEFETAIADSKKLLAKPDNDELLSLYGPSTSVPGILVTEEQR